MLMEGIRDAPQLQSLQQEDLLWLSFLFIFFQSVFKQRKIIGGVYKHCWLIFFVQFLS